MKSLIFDSSSVISITTNNLIDVLKSLRKKFDGEFYIANAVRSELIDVPLHGKRYKLEAIMVADMINKNILRLYGQDMDERTDYISNLANSIFKAKGSLIKIVHRGEAESLAIACKENSTLVIDERTTRLLVEDAELLAALLRKKLHTKVFMDRKKLEEFRQTVGKIKIIRSIELMTIAWEIGLMNEYLEKNDFLNNKHELLDAVLWGLKLRGCSISGGEINRILQLEG